MNKTIISVLFLFLQSYNVFSTDFIFSPKRYNKWDVGFSTGVSLAKIPTAISEEEINQSPMLFGYFRLGLPCNISTDIDFQSNYIANYGYISLFWTYEYYNFSLAFGGKFAGWFGHLDLEAIKLKAEGMVLSPFISCGYDFDDLKLSLQFETQTNRMWTQIDDRELGRFENELSGFAVALNIEQPLWHEHWVALRVRMNYTKFFYQSWLSYNTINEKLLFPEFIFGFNL
jgi:hypothetical protein